MPPSVRYYNQSGPFWDWIAAMEEQGSSHPWFANRGEAAENNNEGQQQAPPWTEGWAGFPWGGPVPHRGRHGHGPHHHGPAPPPLPPDAEVPPPADGKDPEAGPSEPRGPPPPFSEEPPRGPPGRHGHGGPGGRGGRCGGRGRAGFPGRGRGPFGGHGGFPIPMGGFGGLAEAFQNQLFGDNTTKDSSEDFKPEVDVFDTAEAFVVHVSLPGAKKEDVGVNWDAEKSELSIAGVVYRPGDEEFLKTLAMDERKVGAFERKVRLGSRANPAQVDVDAITARMEDGVLRIEVPKLDSGYVEIKKVDID